MDRGEQLFSKYDFHAAVSGAPARMVEAIGKLNDEELFRADEEKLQDALVAAHLIAVPILDVNATVASEREVDIDVRHDPRRAIFDRSRPTYIQATEISFRVPYNGDADVFRCVPSSFSLNYPYAEIERDAIVVRVVRQDQNPAEYRKEFDNTINQIQEALNQLRADCAGLEQKLRETASGHLAKRREKRQKDRSLIEGLGFGKAQSQ
jgi:hypothetical protein